MDYLRAFVIVASLGMFAASFGSVPLSDEMGIGGIRGPSLEIAGNPRPSLNVRNNEGGPLCISKIECLGQSCGELAFVWTPRRTLLEGTDPGGGRHLWALRPGEFPARLPIPVGTEEVGGATRIFEEPVQLLGFCLAPGEERREILPRFEEGVEGVRVQWFRPGEVWNATGLWEPLGSIMALRYDILRVPWPRPPRPGEMVQNNFRNELMGLVPAETRVAVKMLPQPADR